MGHIQFISNIQCYPKAMQNIAFHLTELQGLLLKLYHIIRFLSEINFSILWEVYVKPHTGSCKKSS